MRIALTTTRILGVTTFALGCGADQAVEPTILTGGPLAAVASGSQLASPSNAGAVAQSNSRIDISWQDNSSNETGFEVHRSTTGSSGSFGPLATTGRDAVAHSDPGLSAAAQYCYRIRAFRATGNKVNYSPFSSAACATTPEPPPSPYAVSTRPISSSAVEVSVIRTNVSSAPAYRRYRSTDGGATWELVTSPARAGAFWFQEYPRASEQSVCYRVVAYDAAGDAAPSNTDCTSPPARPTDLTATDVDAQTIALTWNDNSTVEDGYQVWFVFERFFCACGETACNSGSETGENLVADLPSNSTVYRAPAFSADCNDVSRYYVVATKDGGRSDWSNELNAYGALGSAASRSRRAPAGGARFVAKLPATRITSDESIARAHRAKAASHTSEGLLYRFAPRGR